MCASTLQRTAKTRFFLQHAAKTMVSKLLGCMRNNANCAPSRRLAFRSITSWLQTCQRHGCHSHWRRLLPTPPHSIEHSDSHAGLKPRRGPGTNEIQCTEGGHVQAGEVQHKWCGSYTSNHTQHCWPRWAGRRLESPPPSTADWE